MAIDFISGWLGGCAGLYAAHPFDTIKVRLQTDGLKGQYKGMIDGFIQTFEREGSFALYKGVTSPLFGVALINGIVFGTYGPTLRWWQNRRQQSGQTPSRSSHYYDVFVAGAVAGFVQSFVCSPVELAKINLQLQKDKVGIMGRPAQNAGRLYTGPVDVMKKLIRQQGVRGFYRGLNSTLLRDVPAFGVYFASDEFFCNWLAGENGSVADLAAWQVMLAGGSAGCASWIINVPFDVVKSRIQGDSITQPKYRGVVDCFTKVSKEGLRALFRGTVPILIRAFLTNAATFVVYKYSLKSMNRWLQQEE